MKYIVVLLDAEGMQTKRYIDATKMSDNDTFVTFHNKAKVCMLAKDSILSISTEGYEPSELVEKPVSRAVKNAKLIELYKRKS
jgi:hypothetical protein